VRELTETGVATPGEAEATPGLATAGGPAGTLIVFTLRLCMTSGGVAASVPVEASGRRAMPAATVPPTNSAVTPAATWSLLARLMAAMLDGGAEAAVRAR
jgi:hypothetical protein